MSSLRRLDFAYAQYGKAVVRQMRGDALMNPVFPLNDREAFDYFAQLDPTFSHARKPYRHLNWLIRVYLENAPDFQTFENIGFYLSVFERKKSRLPADQRDLNLYSYDGLIETAQSLSRINLPDALSFNHRIVKNAGPDMTILYDGPEGVAAVPHSLQAMDKLSAGTKWPVRRGDQQNWFFSLYEECPIIVLLPSGENDRYFHHVEFSQALNAAGHNTYTPSDTLLSLRDRVAEEYPALSVILGLEEQTILHILDDPRIPVQSFPRLRFDNHLDRQQARLALQYNGSYLRHLPKEFKKSAEMVDTAMAHDGAALIYADKSFQHDRSRVVAAIRSGARILPALPRKWRQDEALAGELMASDPESFRYLDISLRAKPDIAIAFVAEEGMCMLHVPPTLKRNRDFVIPAILENPESYNFLPREQRSQKDLALTALNTTLHAIPYIPPAIWKQIDGQTRQNAFYAGLDRHWSAIQYAHDCGVTLSPRQERQILEKAVIEAVQNNMVEDLEEALYLFPSLRQPFFEDVITINDARHILAKAHEKHLPHYHLKIVRPG